MTIEKDFFLQKLKKAGLLLGVLVDAEIALAIYEELKNEEQKDLLPALRDLAFSGQRVNLANIMTHLAHHKAVRREKEVEKEKKQREDELNMMLRDEGIPEEVKAFLKGFKKL